jgi:RHS repeat-associated protein
MPFGNLLSSVGEGASVFQFTGEYRDGTGLTYLRVRYLDNDQGRFLSKDMWAGDYQQPMSYNSWLYVYANPVIYVDPSGLNGNCPGCTPVPPPMPTPVPIPAKIPTPLLIGTHECGIGNLTDADEIKDSWLRQTEVPYPPSSTYIAMPTPPPGSTILDGKVYAVSGNGKLVQIWPSEHKYMGIETGVGWRVEYSMQAGGVGTDFNLDLRLIEHQLRLVLESGHQFGPSIGTNVTTGPLYLLPASRENQIQGPDIDYSGGNIPLHWLGVPISIEPEVGISKDTTIYYLGVSEPVGFEVGLHESYNIEWFNIVLIDMRY